MIGPGPAALIGAIAITASLVRERSSPRVYLNNLVNYTWCPLVAGLFFYWAVRAAGVDHNAGVVLRAGRRDVPGDARGELRDRRRLRQLRRALAAGRGRGADAGADAPGGGRVRAHDRGRRVPHLSGRYWRSAAVGNRAGGAVVPFQCAADVQTRGPMPCSGSPRTDGLTGLANRARLHDAIEERVRPRPRAGEPVAAAAAWTWTASRRSTTRSAISAATRCCASWGRAWSMAIGPDGAGRPAGG